MAKAHRVLKAKRKGLARRAKIKNHRGTAGKRKATEQMAKNSMPSPVKKMSGPKGESKNRSSFDGGREPMEKPILGISFVR